MPEASENHDHQHCVRAALDNAEALCKSRGLRFTALRRRVLKIVWDGHRPVGAYDILERLTTEGRRTAPPTVYRALEFLIDAGLVHRLDSVNAFVGCPDPSRSHAGQFLICERCKTVVELDDSDITADLARRAREHGFDVNRQMLELLGFCEVCRNAPDLS